MPNADVRNLILGAIKNGLRHKITKSGIMFLGENGESTSIHFSTSDQRAVQQIKKHFRQLGYDPGRK